MPRKRTPRAVKQAYVRDPEMEQAIYNVAQFSPTSEIVGYEVSETKPDFLLAPMYGEVRRGRGIYSRRHV